MKIRKWALPSYLFGGIFEYLINIHYIIAFFLLTVLFSLPLFTLGPSVLAYCSCLRTIADERKPRFRQYFTEWKASFRPGLPYSALLILEVLSAGCSLYLIPTGGNEKMIGIVALIVVIVLFMATIYYPFAAQNEKNAKKLVALSATYMAQNGLDTLCIISVGVILAIILINLHDLAFFFVFPTLWPYFIARVIEANNQQIDAEKDQDEAMVNPRRKRKQLWKRHERD